MALSGPERRVLPNLLCINELIAASHPGVLQGGRHVEGASSPERAAIVGGRDERRSVRDGIGMDGQRGRQPICEGSSRYQSTRACVSPVRFLIPI